MGNMEKRIEANSKGIDSGEVDKRVKSAKEELSAKIAADNKALEKKLDATAADVKKVNDIGGKVSKQEEKLAKLEASAKSSNASGLQTGDELKKEMDKALKESLKSVEGKLAAQEAATKEIATIKTGVASVETKAKDIDSIKTQIKVVETRVTAVESHVKESEKLGKENTD